MSVQRDREQAEKALSHPLVREVMEEFAENMSFKLEGLPHYGLVKVAHYAASVARAQALGIDPDALRMTAEEVGEKQMVMLRRRAAKGLSTVVVIDADGGAESGETS